MEKRTVFESLVSELSSHERRNMLERIGERVVAAGDEPLSVDRDEASIDLDAQYRAMGFWQRLAMFFQALFGGQDRTVVLERRVLANIARSVNGTTAGLIDTRDGTVGGGLSMELSRLRDAANLLSPPLRSCSGADKADFLVFLSGIEMTEFQELVLARTDPFGVAESHSDLTDIEIKRRLDRNLDDMLGALPAIGRQRMYQDAQFLYLLQQLISFRFDDLLTHFSQEGASENPSAPFTEVREQIGRLASIILSLNQTPNPGFVEAMFLFANRDRLIEERSSGGGAAGRLSGKQESSPGSGTSRMPAGSQLDGRESGDEFEQTIQRQVVRGLEAFEMVRIFSRRVPLRNLMRCITGNLSYRAEVIRGGEDWLAVLRRYWRDRTEETFRRFVFVRKRSEMLQESASLLDGGVPVPVHGYPSDRADGGSGRFGTTLSVAKAFFSTVFPLKIARPFKTLVIDGQFYKEVNRAEFVEGYNVLEQAMARIKAIESRLKPEGDYGRALRSLGGLEGVTAVSPDATLRAMEEDVGGLLDGAISALRSVAEVVHGILYGEVGGRFDTLSNLGYLGGSHNKEYLQTLDVALRKCRDAVRILGDSYDLESLRR